MGITDVGVTRIGQIASDGLRFVASHVAVGSGGFNPGTPVVADPLVSADTTLSAETFRKAIPTDNTTLDTIETPRGKETTYTSLGEDEYQGLVGEAGLFATITDAGTSGLTVGDTFLLAHAHFPRFSITDKSRLSLVWPIDYSP